MPDDPDNDENTNVDYEFDDTTSTNCANGLLSVVPTDLLSIFIKKNLEGSFSKCKHCEKHLSKSCLNPKLNVDKLSSKCIEKERRKIRENVPNFRVNNSAVSETSATATAYSSIEMKIRQSLTTDPNDFSVDHQKANNFNERNRAEKAKKSDFTSFLGKMLLRLQKKDVDKHFDLPVAEKFNALLAFDYSKVISQPMDFRTMKSKLHKYKDMLSFRTDFELICKNAMSYNKSDTIYYKKAKEMLEFGQKLFVQQSSQIESGDLEESLEDSDIEILWTNPQTPKPINLRSELVSPLVKVKIENIQHDASEKTQNYSEIFDKSKWEKLRSDTMNLFANLKESNKAGPLTSTYVKHMKFGLNQKLKEFNQLNLEGQEDKIIQKKEGCVRTINHYISSLESKEKSLQKEQPPLVKRQNEETDTPNQPKRRRIGENSENDSNTSENDSNISENDSNISENGTNDFNNQDTNKTGEDSDGIEPGIEESKNDITNTTPENKVGKRRIKFVPITNVKEEPVDVKPKRTLINYFVCPICDEKDGAIFRSEEISKVRKHIVMEHKYSEEKQVQTGLSIPNVPMYAII